MGVLHPYLEITREITCFVYYLKTVNTFMKNNVRILK